MQIFLTIIIPFYNEAEIIKQCYLELKYVFQNYKYSTEFIFIDDGSKDQSCKILQELAKDDSRIKLIQLSRNFGKEAAISAGLDIANGTYVCQIDADLQDPPELIPQMIEYAQNNNLDVVYGVRKSRKGETIIKKLTAFCFYKILHKMTAIKIPEHTGDFRIMTHEVVLALRELKETQRFMKGLFTWVGFQQAGFLYERNARYAGTTKFNYFKLWNFAIEGITSFSTAPLKLATYVGFFFAIGAFFLAIFYIIKYVYFGEHIQGFLTLIVTILFIGGIQIIFLGIIGEYLGRIYSEAKHRPLYLVKKVITEEVMVENNKYIE